MTSLWLSRKEAAQRVGRSERTIARWAEARAVREVLGRYSEPELLEADRMMRKRRAHTGEHLTPKARPDVRALLRQAQAQLHDHIRDVDPHGLWDWSVELIDGPGENEVYLRARPMTRV